MNRMKCENCEEDKNFVDIQNFTITYLETVSYNCCSLKCAKECGEKNGVDGNDVQNIE